MGTSAHDRPNGSFPSGTPIPGDIDSSRWQLEREQMATPEDSEHLRLIIDTASLFIWQMNLTAQRVSVSSNARSVIGFAFPVDIDEINALIHPEDRVHVEEQFAELHGHERRFEAEYRLVGPNGQVVWVHSRAVWAGDGGDHQRVVGVTQNITERKLRELNADYLVNLQDAIRPLADAEAIVREATRLLGEHLAVDQVTYAEPDANGTVMVWPAYAAGQPGFDERVMISELDPQATRDIASGHTVVITDANDNIALTERQRALYAQARSRARISVPLVKNGRLVGALAVHQPEPRAWRPQEVALVEETAERIWSALRRARAEQALASNQAHLARQARLLDTILTHVGHLIFVWSPDKRFVYANRALEQLWGLPPDAYKGKTTAELGYPQELTEQFNRQIDQVVATRAPITDEVPYTNPSGAFGYYEYTITPVIGVDGRVELIAGVARDTTERREAQDALRASEERLRQALEIDTVGVIFFRIGGAVTYVNDAFLRMSGYAREDLESGRVRWDTITPPEWMAPSRHALEEFERDGRSTPFEKEYVRADGSRWWVLSTTSRISEDEGVQFVIDITELKRAEADRDRLAAIVEQTRDAVVGFDLDGRITDWNPAAEALCGYTAAETVGREVTMLVPPERIGAFHDDLARLREGREVAPFESVWIRKDGSPIDLEIQASAMRDTAGNIIGVAAIARDATGRKRLERAQDDFLAMVSHDLRSPVTVLSGRAQLMKRRKAYDETGVEVILEQGRRIERLVHDLQELVRMESGGTELRREQVDLVALARNAAEHARTAAPDHPIRLEAPDEPVVGAWDPDRIGQVLDNLLGNAVKYSPEGGEVTLRIERQGSTARVSVVDRGPGIPPGVLPHLFDRFFRAEKDASSPGLGLGLYISRMLVAAHGGRIWASSTRGRGSTFTFALPIES